MKKFLFILICLCCNFLCLFAESSTALTSFKKGGGFCFQHTDDSKRWFSVNPQYDNVSTNSTITAQFVQNLPAQSGTVTDWRGGYFINGTNTLCKYVKNSNGVIYTEELNYMLFVSHSICSNPYNFSKNQIFGSNQDFSCSGSYYYGDYGRCTITSISYVTGIGTDTYGSTGFRVSFKYLPECYNLSKTFTSPCGNVSTYNYDNFYLNLIIYDDDKNIYTCFSVQLKTTEYPVKKNLSSLNVNANSDHTIKLGTYSGCDVYGLLPGGGSSATFPINFSVSNSFSGNYDDNISTSIEYEECFVNSTNSLTKYYGSGAGISSSHSSSFIQYYTSFCRATTSCVYSPAISTFNCTKNFLRKVIIKSKNAYGSNVQKSIYFVYLNHRPSYDGTLSLPVSCFNSSQTLSYTCKSDFGLKFYYPDLETYFKFISKYSNYKWKFSVGSISQTYESGGFSINYGVSPYLEIYPTSSENGRNVNFSFTYSYGCDNSYSQSKSINKSGTLSFYSDFKPGTLTDAIHDYGVDGTVMQSTAASGGVSTSYRWYFTYDRSLLNNLSSHTGWTDWTAAGAASQNNATSGVTKHLYFKRIETNSCGAPSGILSKNSSNDGRQYSVLKTKIKATITNSNTNKSLCYGNNNTTLSVSALGGAGANYSYSWRRKTSNGSWEDLSSCTTNTCTAVNLTCCYTYECTIHDPFYDNDCKCVVSSNISIYPQLIAGQSCSSSIGQANVNYGDSYNLIGGAGSGGSSNLSYYWKKRKANTQDVYTTFINNLGLSINVSPEFNSEYILVTKDNVTGEEKISNNSFVVNVNLYPGHIIIENQDLDTTICFGGNVSIVSFEEAKGGSGSYVYNWRYSTDNGAHFDTFLSQSWGNLTCDDKSLGILTNNHKSLLIYRIVREQGNSDNYAHSDTISIEVLPEFKVRFPSDDTICYGMMPDTLLVYPSGGTNNYSYSWYYKDVFYGNVLLSETDSLYNWNNLKYGVPEQIGITPYRVEVSDNCGSSSGFGTKGGDFNIYMLGNLSLSSPAFYSTLNEAGSGKSVIDHDYGKEKVIYAKIPDNQMPIGGSGNFVYHWYGKNIGNSWDNGYDNSNLTSLLINCQLLTDTMLYRYSVSDLSCQNRIYYSDSIRLNIISFNKPVLNNNQVQQLCYNSIPEPIRMTTRPGVAKYTYSWYKSVDGGQTYSELLGYVGDTLVFADVANNRLTSDALFKVRVQLGIGSNARYLESDPITVQVVSQVNPGQITIGNGGNGSIVDNDTVVYNMTSPLLRNLQSADGGYINASSVSYQWYKKEGAQTIFSPIDGAINADYQPGQAKLTTSYYRAVNDVCASSYSNIVTVNVKNVSISENIGGNNGGNSENGGGNNNGGNNGPGNQGGNNGNNGGNNNGGESNNGTQNYDGLLDLTPDLDYLGDDFVYQGGGIWEKTSGNNPLKKARYCRGSNVNLNLNVDIVGTYIWLDDSDNEIKKGSKFSISNIQNDTIVKAQIYDTEGVLVLEQLYVITVVDAYPEFKASKVHVEAGESVRFTNSTKDLKSALWSFGDGTDVSFADEPWHYFVKPGTFNVTLTAVNKLGCKSTLTKNEYIIVDEYSGSEYTDINDNKSFDVQVFPNPAKDILYVRSEKDLSIKMFSSQGAILFSADNSNDFDIDMANLSEGVYMLKISDGSWTISRKVIKQ